MKLSIIIFFFAILCNQKCIRKYGLMNMMIKHYLNGLIYLFIFFSLTLIILFAYPIVGLNGLFSLNTYLYYNSVQVFVDKFRVTVKLTVFKFLN